MKTLAITLSIVALVIIGGIVWITMSGSNQNSVNTQTNTGNPSTNPTITPKVVDIIGAISNNHGHSVVLTVAQQNEGQAVTLDLASGAGHTHTLSFSASQVQDAKAGIKVQATSSVDSGHSHAVTFN